MSLDMRHEPESDEVPSSSAGFSAPAPIHQTPIATHVTHPKTLGSSATVANRNQPVANAGASAQPPPASAARPRPVLNPTHIQGDMSDASRRKAAMVACLIALFLIAAGSLSAWLKLPMQPPTFGLLHLGLGEREPSAPAWLFAVAHDVMLALIALIVAWGMTLAHISPPIPSNTDREWLLYGLRQYRRAYWRYAPRVIVATLIAIGFHLYGHTILATLIELYGIFEFGRLTYFLLVPSSRCYVLVIMDNRLGFGNRIAIGGGHGAAYHDLTILHDKFISASVETSLLARGLGFSHLIIRYKIEDGSTCAISIRSLGNINQLTRLVQDLHSKFRLGIDPITLHAPSINPITRDQVRSELPR